MTYRGLVCLNHIIPSQEPKKRANEFPTIALGDAWSAQDLQKFLCLVDLFDLNDIKGSFRKKRFCRLHRLASLVVFVNRETETHVFVNLSEAVAPTIQSSRVKLKWDPYRKNS